MCVTNSQQGVTRPSNIVRKTIRKKLWQLDESFHCSVIGTCFTLEELHMIAKKCLPSVDGNVFDYELHSTFVCLTQYSSSAAHFCQKYLDKKYRSLIRRYAGLKTDKDILTIWNHALASGDVAGIYWVIVTHPHSSEDLLCQIFGEIHMLSHLSGASTRVDIKDLGKLRDEKIAAEKELQKNNEIFNKRLIKKQREIDVFKKLQELQKQNVVEIKQLKVRVKELESNKQEQLEKTVETLSERLYTTTSQHSSAKKKIQALKELLENEQKRNNFLANELNESLAERDAAETVLQKLLASHCEQECTDSSQKICPINNLEGRNILYVGGRVNQCPHFKSLVEQSNGSFLYHDGGKEDGRSKLDGVLAQADAIVCPTDCVSHDAYKCIKTHCAKQEKQLIMIAHASLASFTKGLSEVLV